MRCIVLIWFRDEAQRTVFEWPTGYVRIRATYCTRQQVVKKLIFRVRPMLRFLPKAQGHFLKGVLYAGFNI